jgi:glucan phosphoethanolaminetransferase (alkaline phosphatase superfamily)
MRKAGYHNVYLDAQGKEEWANYQNFMNEHEVSFIDDVFWLRQELAYESDGAAREKLLHYLRQPGKTFIMLNKYGLHFPYFRSYPEEARLFTPALGPGEPMADREKAMNSYRNGIRWAVDGWFKALLAESGGFQPFVIIYTSDHGQNIVDDGTLATHCRPRANRFEGIVPMVAFTNAQKILEQYRSAQAGSYNRTSHFQIFPSLIALAGYDGSWVRSHYGVSLSEHPADRPEFFAGDIHGRGSVRQWVPVFAAPAATSAD